VHALELPQTGLRAGRQQRRRASGLARSGPEAAPPRTLHDQRRSRVRKQSRRHPRPLFAPAATRGRVLRRGEDRHSSLGPSRSRPAALAGTRRTPRLNPPPRHPSREFVAFLREVVAVCPPRQQIHIILDNLSAHKTQAVREFLHQHPRVRFHFTPTYSSWLNQVEIWFAKIEREVIARGIFTSVSDLARKLRRYINAYSAKARPIQWKYSA